MQARFPVCATILVLLACPTNWAQEQREELAARRVAEPTTRVTTESHTTLYRPLTQLSAGWEAYRQQEAQRQWQAGRQRDLIDALRWWSQGDGPYLFSYGAQLPWQNVFEPWWSLPGDIYGYRVPQIVRQPAGHRITFYGPNAYTYGPVYGDDEAIGGGTPLFQAPVPAARHPGAGREDRVREEPPIPIAAQALADARGSFRAGKYDEALDLLARIDPADARIAPQAALVRCQSLFALTRYVEAAAALQQAMQALPVDDCGAVVLNFRDYYGNAKEFTRQLRSLESYVGEQPESFSARLLLGFQYGFLGHSREAIQQLQEALRLSPDDPEAAALLEFFRGPLRPARQAELRRF